GSVRFAGPMDALQVSSNASGPRAIPRPCRDWHRPCVGHGESANPLSSPQKDETVAAASTDAPRSSVSKHPAADRRPMVPRIEPHPCWRTPRIARECAGVFDEAEEETAAAGSVRAAVV